MKKIKRVLVVTDVQIGFIMKGVLANKGLIRIVPEIIRLIVEDFNEVEDEIIFLLDTHDKNAVEFLRFNGEEHCVENEEESKIVPQLEPYIKGKKVFRKNSTMVYALNEYRDFLDDNPEIVEMVFVGLLLDMCAFDAAYPTKKHFEQQNRNVRIIVPQNAVATYSWPGHDENQMTEIANIMLNQAGIETPEVYVKRRGYNGK